MGMYVHHCISSDPTLTNLKAQSRAPVLFAGTALTVFVNQNPHFDPAFRRSAASKTSFATKPSPMVKPGRMASNLSI